MNILGIDPGFGRMGYGVLDVSQHTNHKAVDFGCVETSKKLKHEDRLLQIYNEVEKLIKKHTPQKLAIEELFFHKNVTTALGVSEARGVVLLAAANNKISVVQVKPVQVKQTVTGNGRAQKQQVQKMVQILLKLKEKPRPDDTADALAVAITAARMVWQDSLL